MSKIHLTADQWGGARVGADGKLKVWKRGKNASMKRKWATSKKQTVISRRTAAKLARP